MHITRRFYFFIFVSVIVLTQSMFGKTEGQWQNIPNQRIQEAFTKKGGSFALPNWSDTFGGVLSAGFILLAQYRYFPEAARKLQEFFFLHVQHKEIVERCVFLIPAMLIGGWVFFELRQYTSAGLHDRAAAVLSNLNFKCAEHAFASVYDFFQYLADHCDAREARIINDEFNYVMTYKFLSKILLEFSYALRLLERSLVWASDSAFKAQVDSMMYGIRLKMKNVTHNKIMFERDPQYAIQLMQYQQQQHLSNADRITETVVSQHSFSKVKFFVKVVGNIFGFFFGSRKKD